MRRKLWAVVAAMAALCASVLVAGPAAATAGLPNDPAASGYIGLCDEAGHNVTGGSIDTVPFVWKAVSSTAPPAQFQGPGENAVLNIYQPRPQVLPAEWSGHPLTAASYYSSKAHPAVQATYGDESLADFTSIYPPLVDGLYVLRMGYGKADYGLYDRTYPSTTIQVQGTRWKVVAGGTVDCSTAKAVSNEQLTGVVTKQQYTPHATPPPGQTIAGAAAGAAPSAITQTPDPVGSSHAATTGVGGAPAGRTASTGAAAAVGSGGTGGSGGSGGTGWVWFVIVPALVLAGLAVLALRRRSTAAPLDPRGAS